MIGFLLPVLAAALGLYDAVRRWVLTMAAALFVLTLARGLCTRPPRRRRRRRWAR